ncbi:hypothetical protein SAMN05444170_5873 [Bradyrhizobium erythrophlei]|uniref:Uncharacterized protein n=1 Tax=Bradyrhizobium erythrophlei TaxID=1437360 RepID=A0A1M7UN92_9BRAD|nr:hypothetical protein SAMN05444170_5873 [Bradyrhizobium erythrophlei]
MRSTRCVSSDRCSYHWSSIIPSRPELTTVIASHLAVGVQSVGGSLRRLPVALTHANDYRCVSMMLQYRNSLLSSRRVFHAETVAAELSLLPSNKDQPQ